MNKILEQFYKDNRELLLKRLYYRAGSAENAEDILHNAILRAYTYKDSFDPRRQPLGAWFNTIMNNALKSFKRDEKMMGCTIEYEEEMSGGYEMSQTNPDLVEHLVAEIEACKPDSKSILHLYFLKEYRPREIRQVLDLPYKTITGTVNRFKCEMKAKYGETI